MNTLDTDLTDEQWLLIKPLVPRPKRGGRRRSTNVRHVIDSILYLVKTGCQWRMLRRYPNLPWQTVYRYFEAWRRKGFWKNTLYSLVKKERKRNKRKFHPSVIIIDSQSTRTGKYASVHTRHIDGGKKVKGRKRHFAVDTNGLLLDVSVTPANVHDNKGGRKVIKRLMRRAKLKESILSVYADKGYSGQVFSEWVADNLEAKVKVGGSKAKAQKRFVPEKKRWVVERSFSWIRDYRRLTEDMERDVKNSVTMIKLAFIRVLLRRLLPVEREWV